jgi:hypothetical protein
MKNSSDTIGNQTSDHPACDSVTHICVQIQSARSIYTAPETKQPDSYLGFTVHMIIL